MLLRLVDLGLGMYCGGLLAMLLKQRAEGTLSLSNAAQAVMWPGSAGCELYDLLAPKIMLLVKLSISAMNWIRTKLAKKDTV